MCEFCNFNLKKESIMDIKTKIEKVISTYRITEDHMDNTWSNLQKALDKKSTANAFASIDPQLAMLRVIEYLMGDGNIYNPYEMYFNIDASEHRYQKQVGTTASGDKIYEDSDEVVPVGQLGTLRFIQPILESFHKKTRDGKDNSAIAQTLKVAGYQQAKALRDATLANKGAGTRDQDCIASTRFNQLSKLGTRQLKERLLFLGHKSKHKLTQLLLSKSKPCSTKSELMQRLARYSVTKLLSPSSKSKLTKPMASTAKPSTRAVPTGYCSPFRRYQMIRYALINLFMLTCTLYMIAVIILAI